VRGYWGDIVQSPYIPHGVEVWQEREWDLFKKRINYQQVYFSYDFCIFNLHFYIQMLEDLTAYHFPFTRIKEIDKELGGDGKINPEDPNEKSLD